MKMKDLKQLKLKQRIATMSKNTIEFKKMPGGVVMPVTKDLFNASNTLPPNHYTVMYSDDSGYFLKEKPAGGAIPKKLYQTAKQTQLLDDICKAYFASSKSLGVIAVGYKGCGKSLLSAQIAEHLLSKDIAIVNIEDPYYGVAFNNFIDSLGECVLIFDELTKTYDKPYIVHKLLSLFDGRSMTKRLTIVTDNEVDKLSKYMLGRPNRFKYLISFGSIARELIDMYLDDQKKLTKTHLKNLKEYFYSVPKLNFDTMDTVVKEVLLFPKRSLSDLVSRLNTDVPDLEIVVEGKDITIEDKKLAKKYQITNIVYTKKRVRATLRPVARAIKTSNRSPMRMRMDARSLNNSCKFSHIDDGKVYFNISPYNDEEPNGILVSFKFERDDGVDYNWLSYSPNESSYDY